jgi:8-oxo-dGTP pyrophosphatase MutT (NUDIX family)
MYGRKTADAQTRVKVGLGVLVVDPQGRILLEKRSDSGMWGLPGGAVDTGESITMAALREVKEETGLEVRITRVIGVYSEPTRRILVYPDNRRCAPSGGCCPGDGIISGELSITFESLELLFSHRTPCRRKSLRRCCSLSKTISKG